MKTEHHYVAYTCLIVLIVLIIFQVPAVLRHWKESEANETLKGNIELRLRVYSSTYYFELLCGLR